VAAVILAVGMALQIDPDSRLKTTLTWPSVGDKSQSIGRWPAQSFAEFSPDGKFLIIGHWPSRSHVNNRTQFLRFLDLSSGDLSTFCEQMAPALTFSPDGSQITGIWHGTVYVWDRRSWRELRQFSPAWLQEETLPWLPAIAFHHEGELLILMLEVTRGDNLRALDVREAESGEARKIDKKRIEELLECPFSPRLSEVTSADGSCSVSESKPGHYVVVNSVSGERRTILSHAEIGDPTLYGISPDGNAVLIWGTRFRRLESALSFIRSVYFGGQEYTGKRGLFCLDIDTGDEIGFFDASVIGSDMIDGDFGEGILKDRTYGFTPDGSAIVLITRKDDGQHTQQIAVYEWPPRKPWWKVPVMSLLAWFVAYLSLHSLHWAWNRRPLFRKRPAIVPSHDGPSQVIQSSPETRD
jgi:hypothetical protein